MAGLLQQTLPSVEPVTLTDAKNFLKINTPKDDGLITSLITASRVYCEDATGLFLASRNFVQYRDAMPTFPFLPNPYSPYVYPFGYPLVTNYPLWNYGAAQPMKPMDLNLMAWPVTDVDHITYIGLDGEPHTLQPDEDFLVDLASMPARISPLENDIWPMTAPSANAVAIYFTAGFNAVPSTVQDVTATNVPDPPDQIVETEFVIGIPETLRLAIKMLLSHWYFNRDAVAGGAATSVPHGFENLINLNRVFNFNLIDTVSG